MTDEERQRFARRLRERDAEIERLQAVSAELHDALDEVIIWYSSGFAPQSQAMALRKANAAMANYRALEPKP